MSWLPWCFLFQGLSQCDLIAIVPLLSCFIEFIIRLLKLINLEEFFTFVIQVT